MLTRLSRYVLAETLVPFLGGLFFFIFVMLMFQLLRLSELFIQHGVGLPILAKIVSLMTLTFMPLVLPVAFLIAMLVGFGRLSVDSELVAMKSSGVSLDRMAMPALGFGVLVFIFSLALNMEWVPWAERTLRNVIIKVSNTKAASAIQEGAFTKGFFDLLIFADKVDTKTNHLKKVFIYDERDPKNPLTVVAQQGEIQPVKSRSEFGTSAVLKLQNGSIHRNDRTTQDYQKIDFSDYRLFLKIDEGSANNSIGPQMYEYPDLLQEIRKTKPGTFEYREFRGEFWRRWAIALSPLIFVFLGIGFAAARTREVRAGAGLIAFLTLLTYWVLQTLGSMALSKDWLIAPVAMMIPNAVAGTVALFAYRRARW